MPRIGRWPRLALAGCCLLLALDSAVSAHGATRAASDTDGGTRRPVVVATHSLGAGRRLIAADLALARWPPDLVPSDAFGRIDELVGRRLASAVSAREMLTSARLVGRDLISGLPTGELAVPVTLGDRRAGELFRPGDYLDLLASPRSDAEIGTEVLHQGSAASVAIVGEHLLVLAVMPGDSEVGSELVVAADRATALRITRLGVSQILAGVGVPP